MVAREAYFKECSQADVERYNVSKEECERILDAAYSKCTAELARRADEKISLDKSSILIMALGGCKSRTFDQEVIKFREELAQEPR